MKIIIILGVSILLLHAQSNADQQAQNKTYDCTKVFEARKGELVLQLEKIDEQEQALEALQEASASLLDKKKVKLDEQEAAIVKIKDEIKAKEANIEKLLAENKQVLEDIKKEKTTKITSIYAKMKPGAAAAIFEKMELKEAGEILTALQPKILGKVFAKMKPEKAAELTREMNKTPLPKEKL